MSITALDRTAFNALVDDDGSGTTGSVFAKATLQDIYDKSDALYAAAARAQVYHSTTQSIATSTSTALNFDSEDHDDYGMHSTSVNTSRITIPSGAGGVYLVSAAAVFATNAAGIRLIWIQKNGTTAVSTYAIQLGQSANVAIVQTQCLIALAAADYIEAMVFQDSGGALNVGNATTRELRNQFFAARIL